VDFPDAGFGGVGPAIASATDSSLTAVWSSFDGSSYTVQSSHSADGSSWSAPSQVAVAGGASASPQLVVGPSGTATVVWDDTNGSNGLIQASRSTNNGLTWAVPTTLSGAGADPPRIARAPNGTLAVVWDRFDGSNFIVQSSHSADGATWSPAADLSMAGVSAVSAQIAAAPDSALTAVWSRFDAANSFIIQTSHSVDNGATWDPVVDLSAPATAADAPQAAVASDGGVTAVWSRFNGTNSAIQSAFTGVTPVVLPGAPPAPTAGHHPAPPTAAETPAVPTPEPSVGPAVAPVLKLTFDFTVGENAHGGELTVAGDGFLPDSIVVVTLHSTPKNLGTIAISPTGSFEQSMSLPTSLVAGTHHVEVAYTGADGSSTSKSLYFRVKASGVVTELQSEPTDTPPSWAQSDSPSTTGSGPDTLTVGGVEYPVYLPAQHPAQAVDTVVSSLVLLSILGGVGAVSAFAAGGSIAMAAAAAAAGGARESSSRSGGEASRSASLASAKVKHLKFKSEAVARGDKSSTWDWVGTERLDSLSAALPIALNRFSPLLARVSNDGAYLRAMFGPLWLISSVVGIVLGVLSVVSTHGAAVPPAIGLFVAIIVLSAFDVLGGLLASSVFTIGVIALGGLGTIAEARTLLGIDVIFFTVALTASAARPLRRLPAVSASDWFDRIADVAVASLLATWAVTKMIGALPALSGIVLPIADSALTVALFAGGAIALRYVVETIATYQYPLRLAAVAPAKIGFPSVRQQVVSAVLKTALFVFIAIAYLGNIWPLWVGAALFLIPSIVAAFQAKLPNVPRLVKLIPGGVIKIVLMLCIGKLLGGWLASAIHNPQDLIDQAFVILAIPSLLLGFAGFFGRDGDKWQLNWPIRVGGIVVVIIGVLLVVGVLRIP
jgi:hypothetical protein